MSHGHSSAFASSHSHSGLTRGGSHHGKASVSHHLTSVRSSRHSIRSAHRVAKNGDLAGRKNGFVHGLPRGLESRVDRGKGLPPGWQSKVSFIEPKADLKADQKADRKADRDQNADREQNVDRDLKADQKADRKADREGNGQGQNANNQGD